MSIFDRVANEAAKVAAAKVKIPDDVRARLPLAQKILTGDFDGAINAGLDELFSKLGPLGLPSRWPLSGNALERPTPLFGGLTAQQAKAVFELTRQTTFAKKNLFCISISEINPTSETPPDHNLFATSVTYSAYNVASTPQRIGSGSFGMPENSERKEIRITTLDSERGVLKKWFKQRHNLMCRPDGTFGLPIEYLLRIDIMHAFITSEVTGAVDSHIDSYIVFPTNLEHDLSRREDGLEEIGMSFAEWDTFNSFVP